MGEFLTTTGLTYAIERIIKSAKKKIVIVSPYIKISRNYYERLFEAEARGISVSVVFGKENLSQDQDGLLSEFGKLKLYFCDNLHAKCYLNEQYALISSMNLYEYSQINNREMGIMIDRNNEQGVYDDINSEVESIVNAAERLIKTNSSKKYVDNSRKQGICIRCGCKMKLNQNEPLCKECFIEWNRFGNPFYEEQFCHICGKPERTTIEKPLCYQCFKENC